MGEYLKPDEQAIKIDGHMLPGTVTGIEVTGELRLERQKKEGSSGSTNLIRGYEEASIRITLELLGGDKEIKQLEGIFKQSSAALKSKGVRVVNRHLDARGVRRLIFKGLTTRDDYARGVTVADLSFGEYDMEAAKLEEKDKASSGVGSAVGSVGTGADGAPGQGREGGKPRGENPIFDIMNTVAGKKAYADANTDYNNITTDPLGTLLGWVK